MARRGLLVLKYYGKLTPHEMLSLRQSMSAQLKAANMTAIVLEDGAKWEVYAAVDPADDEASE